ncbi:hypothetical protein HYALB_00001373 [Hymenoscyphus albidus]|uniref:DUF1941-domain-containing protein n=1 Tax=Hymenoscyphus albidus TaxID=595503 RepID=A0A9N9LF68_9HELO|nr:hypothetical protein HYALB_00001373 [Hymenoscyphus albidus]
MSGDLKGENPIAEATGLTDPAATFEKLKELLKTKNDTSRFVGLALLKSVLDNGQLVKDPDRMHILWEALSPKFLDRLLRAQENDKVSNAEAKDMVDLAVAILHTLTNLLPENDLKEKRLTARIGPLTKALVQSSPETTELVLKTLLTIVAHSEGAIRFLSVDDFSPLTEIATQYRLVLDVFTYSWMNASVVNDEVATVRASLDKIIPALLVVFKQTDAVTLIQSLGSFFPKLEPEALNPNPAWLTALISTLRKLVSRKPTLAGRAAYTCLAAALLQAYPARCPILLFKNDVSDTAESKPFSYLLIDLLLIDLRASFPSLLAQLNSTEYTFTSQRLAAAFDILSSFIGFLVRSLDDEGDGIPAFSMPPDLLLKLRKDIAETTSLTIEYLRDRWDSSFAGASGLHPSARIGTAATSEGTRLTLTWESMKDNVMTDPLILAGIRALSIWIREDENENLRNESSGLMDMFMELYKESNKNAVDFRYPILLALEVIALYDNGVQGFLEQSGWEILANDLQSIFQTLLGSHSPNDSSGISEASRGLQIVRVLLAVLDNPTASFPQEEWLAAIPMTASIKPTKSANPIILELQIAALQLSTALLTKVAGGTQKRYVTSIPALSGLVSQLRPLVKGGDPGEVAELMELLEDVSLELENLPRVK